MKNSTPDDPTLEIPSQVTRKRPLNIETDYNILSQEISIGKENRDQTHDHVATPAY